MSHTDIGNQLQKELKALTQKNKDIFNTVLGIAQPTTGFSWSGAAGIAQPDTKEKMTADTPIFIASITKMYTAVVIMRLTEQKRLSLDDPISQFLPASLLQGLHIYKGQDYTNQLTIYHLLSQTSGLADYFEGKSKGGKSLLDRLITTGDEAWDVETAVNIAKSSLTPQFPPEAPSDKQTGNKAHYSDTNFQLLGAIIKAVTDTPLHQAYNEHIIQPLALNHTYLYGYGQAPTPPATFYHQQTPLHIPQAMESFAADGGLVSTIADSLTFLQALMTGQLFNKATTLNQMQNWKPIFFPFAYGLGLMRFKLPRFFSPFAPPPQLIGHSGASSAFLYHHPPTNLYLAGTLNQLANQGRPYRFLLKIINILKT